MAKQLHEEEEPLNQKIRFCTACGDELDEFCFSDQAENIESIRKRHAKCKEIGKFDGDVCARIFIAQQRDTE